MPSADLGDAASVVEVRGVTEVAPPPGGPQPRLRRRLREAVRDRLPEGSKQRAVAKAGLSTYRELLNSAGTIRSLWAIPGVAEPSAPSYRSWLRGHEVSAPQLDAQREASAKAAHAVTVQVVVLPGVGSVEETLTSLRQQSWGHWTAVVCDPTSSTSSEPRTSGQVVFAGGIPVEAANTHVAHGEGDLVILLEAGDQLRPDCLYQVAAAAHRDPLVDLLTWDDDVAVGGTNRDPQIRPSWSPEVLLGAPYVGRAFAVRRARFLAAGGLRPEAGGAQHWDLLLRTDCEAERVTRVTRVLSSVPARTPVPDDDAVRVVQQHLDRKGLSARARAAGDGRVRVHWTPEQWPSVSIIIPTRHNRSMLSTCLPSLQQTDYPAFDVTIVDNGGRDHENERWYATQDLGFPLEVLWWHEQPFNYSAVNNAAVRASSGEVLVFLNDDTEVLDPQWLKELVGWAVQPEIGVAGLQLTGLDGKIQHAGVILGMGGFADHVFEGMDPGSDSIYGRSDWYRNVLAVTGACLAVRREVFDAVGGFDERFILCGSDVALGLDMVLDGRRNICSPFAGIRHLESATRGTTVPTEDFFASYWRYNTWLFGGDPYWSPNLSLGSREPKLRGRHEPTAQQRLAGPLGRDFTAFRQSSDAAESRMLADMCRALPSDVAAVDALHAQNAEPFRVRTVNWFIPDIDSPFYGGINSALRIADELARNHGVENRFVVWGSPPDHFVRSALSAAFPSLADSQIVFFDGSKADLAKVPEADVGIATLWVTAYALAHAQGMKRKFYLIQDFEPMFYPASTLYALAEETYKLGLYGLCNTDNLRQIYADDYDGKGMSFAPAVDDSVFHARWRHQRTPGSPVTVFVYARPGHWRNCWEMASLALEELKRRMGDGVRIVTAGAWAAGQGADDDIKPLGLLPYRATGELYRNSDVGLALTVSKHPSYLPLELMACGVPVVAFDNPWGHWILEHEENSLLSKRTADDLADQLERLCREKELRERLSTRGLQDIQARHSDWDTALSDIYGYLCDPEGRGA
ncbi:glycosyltransferase [Modestobacter sp. VKM Ac-2977]|uniref:rhamnosyltransferase WsaF family glycosyltransferase n=1 Tax=Modestobacter sp. VKM Ac-2977 TaxID=3004131 RepID=UPI0022AA296D|nr:glycosyltransferase [Modestobacter sp. VKM Ac-2977]MCZ2822333.1 glycosyltransferase [Modestobacter sp. VKM Ac-2977]